MYGYCPLCGAEVKDRTRGMPSNDTCKGGHVYPSKMTLAAKPPASRELMQEASQLLATVEGVIGRTDFINAVMRSNATGLHTVLTPGFHRRVRETRILIDAHIVMSDRGLTQ